MRLGLASLGCSPSASLAVKAVVIEDSDPILVRTNTRLLDALRASQLPVLSACGGKGLCATCHVYADAGPEVLSPRTPREQRSLVMLRDAKPSSRLACQAKVLQNGAHILKPGGLYIESATDLDALVGRRAEEPILHPADGRVLIEAGKIITRTRISALTSVEVDVAELRALSLTAP